MINEYLDLTYHNKKVMAVWAVVIGVIVVLVAVVIIPSWRSYFRLKTEAKVLSGQLKFYQRKYNQLANLDANRLKTKINEGLEILPTYHNAPLLIGILSNLSQEHNVKLGGLIFTPGQVGSDSAEIVAKLKSASTKKKNKKAEKLGLNPLKLKLQVSGSMTNIRSFLISLAKIKPLARVDKVSISFKTKPKDNQPAIQPVEDQTSKPSTTQAVASITVDFLAGRLPKTMPSLDSPVYFVPPEVENKYQDIVRSYRSFVSPTDNNQPPPLNGRRLNPFVY